MAIVFCPKCKKQRDHEVRHGPTGRIYTCASCGNAMFRPPKNTGRHRKNEIFYPMPEPEVKHEEPPFFATYSPLPGHPLEYRKKTTIHAVRMETQFKVATLEGTVKGKAGDWLAKGVNGELYPINAEIFEKTYEEVKGGNSNVKKDDVRA